MNASAKRGQAEGLSRTWKQVKGPVFSLGKQRKRGNHGQALKAPTDQIYQSRIKKFHNIGGRSAWIEGRESGTRTEVQGRVWNDPKRVRVMEKGIGSRTMRGL